MRLFISQLRGRPVLGSGGGRLGSLRDLVVAIEEEGYPPARGLVVRAGKRTLFVPMRDVATLDAAQVRLRRDDLPEGAFERRAGEVLLEHDILDRQLIDVKGARVVRANDAEVREIAGRLCLVGIDVGLNGMLRRLGPRLLVQSLGGELVDWAVIDPLATTVPEVQLQLRHTKVTTLHPADIARIIDALAYPQGTEIMQALDTALAADTLEEIEDERQVPIIEALPAARAADILEKMSPDAAADVLDGMPRGQADALIAQMEGAHITASVQLLLSYPTTSAGGVMTTDFIIALEHETTRQAVDYIRRQLDTSDLHLYIYVVDDPDNQQLVGIVSLRDLLVAEPDQALSSYMRRRDLRSIRPEESAAEAARMMTEYNLLALPVTDEEGRMLGLVTADDALDVLLPASLKRHVPRLFR